MSSTSSTIEQHITLFGDLTKIVSQFHWYQQGEKDSEKQVAIDLLNEFLLDPYQECFGYKLYKNPPAWASAFPSLLYVVGQSEAGYKVLVSWNTSKHWPLLEDTTRKERFQKFLEENTKNDMDFRYPTFDKLSKMEWLSQFDFIRWQGLATSRAAVEARLLEEFLQQE